MKETASTHTFTRLLLALLLLSVHSAGCGNEPAGPGPKDLKVLFIGASYLEVNDLPHLFAELARTADKQVFVAGFIRSGYYLDYFAENEQAAKAIEEYKWDYVVLSGGCQNAAYPDNHDELTPGSQYHPVLPALSTLKANIEANNAESKTVYMMPWAFEDGMTWVQGQTDTYEDMQQHIYDNTLAWADSLDLVLAPVGWAWYEVLFHRPMDHYLHMSDWNHPNIRGSYLSACVVFSTLFREDVQGVTFYSEVDYADARYLQEVASRTVMSDLSLWGIDHIAR